MGSEKQPKLAKVELLYAMMSRPVIDIADYMWEVMVDFRENMPLVAYVIWTQVRVSGVGVYLWLRIPPGNDPRKRVLVLIEPWVEDVMVSWFAILGAVCKQKGSKGKGKDPQKGKVIAQGEVQVQARGRSDIVIKECDSAAFQDYGSGSSSLLDVEASGSAEGFSQRLLSCYGEKYKVVGSPNSGGERSKARVSSVGRGRTYDEATRTEALALEGKTRRDIQPSRSTEGRVESAEVAQFPLSGLQECLTQLGGIVVGEPKIGDELVITF
ncbi:hypothetical protein Acr_28g0000580 [Actinidia rufa]|uniref:Uncharacterized protein n=1 Tax=Actinidia rufa TaxID=165716 RepID=A0A7J0H8C4_9ERIC|nr:hypothetical protein Acr_28g0000580 [Actinidia rufa]